MSTSIRGATTLVALLLTTGALASPGSSVTTGARTTAVMAMVQKQQCAGCGKAKGPKLPNLSYEQFTTLLERFAKEPLASKSPALETLLFHGHQAGEYLSVTSDTPLSASHRAFLERELKREHAIVSFRVIDAQGRIRMSIAPKHVPLRVKKHLHTTSTVGVQEAEVSGTAVRVGLDRLWVRY